MQHNALTQSVTNTEDYKYRFVRDCYIRMTKSILDNIDINILMIKSSIQGRNCDEPNIVLTGLEIRVIRWIFMFDQIYRTAHRYPVVYHSLKDINTIITNIIQWCNDNEDYIEKLDAISHSTYDINYLEMLNDIITNARTQQVLSILQSWTIGG